MTSKETQIKNLFIYILPLLIGNLLPFITIPIFTRILTPEDYGVLALAIIYAIFMTGLANFGMTLAFERNYFQYRDDNKKLAQLLFSTISFVFLNFIILGTLTFFLRDKISILLTKSEANGSLIFWTFCATFFFNTINQFFYIYYKNAEKAVIHTKYTLYSSILNFAISIFLVAYLKIGVIGIVFAQLGTGFILFIQFFIRFLNEFRFSINKNILLESLKISYPLTPRIFIGVLHTQFDKYMIGLLATIGGVGVYHIGKKISNLVFIFMTAIQNVFNPQVYKRMFKLGDAGGESIGRYLTPFIYISIFVALCISYFSEEFITILTPVSYHGAIAIIPVLSMYYGFLFFGKITSLQVTYKKKTYITSLLSILGITLNISLNVPMIMKYGAIGAAWATLLSGLISGLISIFVAQKYYRIKWELNKIWTIFGLFFISSILIIYLNGANFAYSYRLLIKCVSLAGYIYIGIRFGIISKENFHLVKSILTFKTAKSFNSNNKIGE